MKLCLLSILLILFSVSIYSQDIDSLYSAFSKAKENEYIRLGNELLKTLESNKHAIDIVEITKETPVSQADAEVNIWMANYSFRKERYDNTIEFTDKVIDFALQTNDSLRLEKAYYLKGFAYQRLGDINMALENAMKSYEINKFYGNEERLSSVINNIANIYQTNNEDSMAIVFYNESIEIERRLGRNQNLAVRLGNISTSYMKQGKIAEAMDVATEALALDRAENRQDKVAARLTQLADIYIKMTDYSKAKDCLEEAISFFEKSNSSYGMAISLNKLGEIEQLTGNISKADEYLTQAAHYADKNGNKYVYNKIAKNIYLLNRDINPAKALKYFEESTALQDSIFGIETQKQINDFRVKYETAEKELEIERQNIIINQQKTFRTILIGSLAIAVIIMLLLWWLFTLRTKRNRELAEINATKDKFFSIISHDLKNPAIAQRNAIQGLLDHAGEMDVESLQQYYAELLKSSDNQIELLYNLLNWAQLQTGRMPFRPAVFDIKTIANNEISLLQTLVNNKSIKLDSQFSWKTMVYGDRTMIAVVIRNLLTNAVKFTFENGEIILKTEIRNSNDLIVSVIDTGIGMDENTLKNLFVLDRQSSNFGTAGEQGSGLGLIVCKELVEKNGGKLEVTSGQGKGSCFSFNIKISNL
ncbi:MAG: tetratricopeptide repeat protein [Bacteroidales bacterium]|jgi:signal transduction histidine kinase|nr:tetratricopeptide repeat protein [Bacteroidales bacterium]